MYLQASDMWTLSVMYLIMQFLEASPL